jgi:hypothetical protein
MRRTRRLASGWRKKWRAHVQRRKMGAHPEDSTTTRRQAAHSEKEAREDHLQKVDCARKNINKPYIA